jgi:hypothetical protein
MSYLLNITPCTPVRANHVSEEHITSIYMIEDYTKQEIKTKQAELRMEALCYSETTTDFTCYMALYPRR